MDTAITIYAGIVTVLLVLVLGQLFRLLTTGPELGVSLRLHLAIRMIEDILSRHSLFWTQSEDDELRHVVLLLITEQESYGAQKVAQQAMRDVTPKREKT